jgi:hypothetical protein
VAEVKLGRLLVQTVVTVSLLGIAGSCAVCAGAAWKLAVALSAPHVVASQQGSALVILHGDLGFEPGDRPTDLR